MTVPTGVEILRAGPGDVDELFTAFSEVVEANEGFPHEPPLTRAQFERAWLADTAVVVARRGAVLAGAYYLRANFPGPGSHIANAGYFVVAAERGAGLGRALVVHSLSEACRLGYDALQFNLVFESNPARSLYERLGFEVIGRVPHAVGGEDALVYWRSLEDVSDGGPAQ